MVSSTRVRINAGTKNMRRENNEKGERVSARKHTHTPPNSLDYDIQRHYN